MNFRSVYKIICCVQNKVLLVKVTIYQKKPKPVLTKQGCCENFKLISVAIGLIFYWSFIDIDLMIKMVYNKINNKRRLIIEVNR